MKLAFTGTRKGMTPAQHRSLGRLLRVLVGRAESVHELHVGVAEGADLQAALLADEFAIPITGHPDDGPSSAEALALCTETRDPLPLLERNTSLVAACDALVACPAWLVEESTEECLRLARGANKPIWTIYPDGDVVKEETQ